MYLPLYCSTFFSTLFFSTFVRLYVVSVRRAHVALLSNCLAVGFIVCHNAHMFMCDYIVNASVYMCVCVFIYLCVYMCAIHMYVCYWYVRAHICVRVLHCECPVCILYTLLCEISYVCFLPYTYVSVRLYMCMFTCVCRTLSGFHVYVCMYVQCY